MNHDDLPNLASERLGAVALSATDDFFAPKENLLRDAAPEWREHEYTDRGKSIDGWESRLRKRNLTRTQDDAAHDAVIVRLAMRGLLRAIVVDTAFFRGNYPSRARDRGEHAPEGTLVSDLESPATRIEIVPRTPLLGDERRVRAEEQNGLHPFADAYLSRRRRRAAAGPRRASPSGRGSVGRQGSSTSPRSRAVGRWCPAATCSSARSTTSSSPGAPAT